MFLADKYKAESFRNQYYEISRAPFVLMGIEPYSKLADALIAIAFTDFQAAIVRDNHFITGWQMHIPISFDPASIKTRNEITEHEPEFCQLAIDYSRIKHEISHSDLVVKWCVNGFIPTDTLLDYGESKRKPAPNGESKDFLKNKDDEETKGPRDKQVTLICDTAKRLGYVDLINIQRGGRAAILAECLSTHILTEDQFIRAWRKAKNDKLIRIENKEKIISDK